MISAIATLTYASQRAYDDGDYANLAESTQCLDNSREIGEHFPQNDRYRAAQADYVGSCRTCNVQARR
jgi:hypothetical protein